MRAMKGKAPLLFFSTAAWSVYTASADASNVRETKLRGHSENFQFQNPREEDFLLENVVDGIEEDAIEVDIDNNVYDDKFDADNLLLNNFVNDYREDEQESVLRDEEGEDYFILKNDATKSIQEHLPNTDKVENNIEADSYDNLSAGKDDVYMTNMDAHDEEGALFQINKEAEIKMKALKAEERLKMETLKVEANIKIEAIEKEKNLKMEEIKNEIANEADYGLEENNFSDEELAKEEEDTMVRGGKGEKFADFYELDEEIAKDEHDEAAERVFEMLDKELENEDIPARMNGLDYTQEKSKYDNEMKIKEDRFEDEDGQAREYEAVNEKEPEDETSNVRDNEETIIEGGMAEQAKQEVFRQNANEGLNTRNDEPMDFFDDLDEEIAEEDFQEDEEMKRNFELLDEQLNNEMKVNSVKNALWDGKNEVTSNSATHYVADGDSIHDEKTFELVGEDATYDDTSAKTMNEDDSENSSEAYNQLVGDDVEYDKAEEDGIYLKNLNLMGTSIKEDFFGDSVSDAITDAVTGILMEDRICPEKNLELKTCFENNEDDCENCVLKYPAINLDGVKLNLDEILKKFCPEMKQLSRYCGCNSCEAEKAAVLECHCGDTSTVQTISGDGEFSGKSSGSQVILKFWTGLAITIMTSFVINVD